MAGNPELFEVVGAFHAVGGFAHLLHGRQQKANQNGDDRDHDEQLDQRKSSMTQPGNHNLDSLFAPGPVRQMVTDSISLADLRLGMNEWFSSNDVKRLPTGCQAENVQSRTD